MLLVPLKTHVITHSHKDRKGQSLNVPHPTIPTPQGTQTSCTLAFLRQCSVDAASKNRLYTQPCADLCRLRAVTAYKSRGNRVSYAVTAYGYAVTAYKSRGNRVSYAVTAYGYAVTAYKSRGNRVSYAVTAYGYAVTAYKSRGNRVSYAVTAYGYAVTA
jgi:uncharacterized protein YxeA